MKLLNRLRDFCGGKRTLVITGKKKDRVYIWWLLVASLHHVHTLLLGDSSEVTWTGLYYTGIALAPYDGTLVETMFPPGIDDEVHPICEKRSRTATSFSE